MSEVGDILSSLTKEQLIQLVWKLNSSLDNSSQSSAGDILVSGMSCRFPMSPNWETFWENLNNGFDGIKAIPSDRWDIEKYFDANPGNPGTSYVNQAGLIEDMAHFDPGYFGILPREANAMNPEHRMALELALDSIEDAGYKIDDLKESRTGVFIAQPSFCEYFGLRHTQDPKALDNYALAGVSNSMTAGRISYWLGLRGPSLAIDTACSSALVAVHLACQSLRSGEIDFALVGAVDLLISPLDLVGRSKAKMLSPDGRCYTFDNRANGYVRGEGGGFLLLSNAKKAKVGARQVWARIAGSAVNQDGRTAGITVPNGRAQEEVIRTALQNAKLNVEQLDYLEAHGTGTALGDPIEVEALANVFSERKSSKLIIGSVKTNIGHLECAAGMAGLIKSILAIYHQKIPRQIHFQKPNERVQFENMPLEVCAETREWPKNNAQRFAGVSSFGFAGTNAHVIVAGVEEGFEKPATNQSLPHINFFCLSARNQEDLNRYLVRYENHLKANPRLDLAHLCHSLWQTRTQLRYRVVIKAQMLQELTDRLHAHNLGVGSKEHFPIKILDCKTKVRIGICINASPLGHEAKSYSTSSSEILKLIRTLSSWGLNPQRVTGDLLGEVFACVLVGEFAQEEADALANSLVAQRWEKNPFFLKEHIAQKRSASKESLDLVGDLRTIEFWQSRAKESVSSENKFKNLLAEVDVALSVELNPSGGLRAKLIRKKGEEQEVFFDQANRNASELLHAIQIELLNLGFNLDSNAFYGGKFKTSLPLPRYPLNRKKYWFEDGQIKAPQERKAPDGFKD